MHVLCILRNLPLCDRNSDSYKGTCTVCWQLVFNDHRDSCLISEVITEDPYGKADPNAVWEKIASTLLITFQRDLPDLKVVLPRTVRDRMTLLLTHFKANDRRKLSRYVHFQVTFFGRHHTLSALTTVSFECTSFQVWHRGRSHQESE